MSDNFAQEVQLVNIENELKQSYLDYAMSVIVGRALPDVRDGLKPVHRRVLYAMKELGNDANKPYKKSARVVGDVIGKYHPHGDSAVYDTMVRMAQDFSMRYRLIDGQGNFGSIDGDAPAAMRYTEVRMAKISHSLLADIDKETVDFSPNYDESEQMPDVLPTRIPNLLVNGSSGIAVGMATNIPPHNLTEVINGVITTIHNPDITISELMNHITGPDFPTYGYINGQSGIIDAYHTGRGRVVMRANAEIESDPKTAKERIVVTEIPYQVNKARLVEKIAELVKEKKIEGIAELRDESDKEGLRIVVDVKKSERADVVLNNLYSQTQLQLNYGVNMVALVNGQPKRLNLKEVVEAFIRHRKEVVTRRSLHELKKARQRVHILEGLAVALANITDVIAKIKASNTSSEAKNQLLNCCWPPGFVQDIIADLDPSLYRLADLPETYGLQDETTYYMSADQVDALLALRLHRLTGLEQDKILSEFRELIERIKYLINVLKNTDKLLEVICEELEEIKQQFGDARKTSILDSTEHFDYEDLIPEENMVVTLSFDGYVKRQPLKEYRAQKRGGRGKSAIKMKSEDAIAQMVVASTHAMMLCFSNYGKVYWRKVHQFPQAGRGSKGKPFNNFLPLHHDEKITTMMAVDDFHQEAFVIMATQNGVIKKTGLKAFSKPRKAGITAITLDQGDALMNVALTNGYYQIMLFSNAGKAVRFSETDVRETGRNTRGVRGMKLHQGQWIVGLVVTRSETSYVLTVTENGYGKRTKVSEYRKTSRGSQGVIAMTTSERNGAVVGAILVDKDDEMMLISDYGTLVRTRVCEVRETARAAQGVNLINLQGSEKLVAIRSISDHAQIESNESEKDS